MRKIILLTLVIFASSAIVKAQTFGYVNTEKILEKMPEYTNAQQQIDRLKKQYEAQIEAEMKVVESMYNQYQSEKQALSDTQRERRESEIINREREAKELQKSYFGQDGTLSDRSKELLNPIKDRVQTAIEKVASEGGIILVFDIATAQGIIYNNPAYDLTPRVLKKLNIL
ncbi:MAG: OmpH family outer membrane protein [Rikenellaceae bacterium]